MIWADVVSYLFSIQAAPPPGPDCEACLGSTLTAVAAAWVTQGYWVHADLLFNLANTGFSYYAPLLYCIAAGAGLVGMALNQPPRIYVWFFLGPALYNVLLFTTQEAGGVLWQVGLNEDGSPHVGNMREVWKLAEVGLRNTNIATREGLTVTATGKPGGGVRGDGTVEVATLFLWWDTLASDAVQTLVAWTGISQQLSSTATTNTNIVQAPLNPGSGIADPDWYLLSNLKWGMLENITSSKINSPAGLDVFANFMASECGDIVAKNLNIGAYTQAVKSKSGEPPNTVFIVPDGTLDTLDYTKFSDELRAQFIPTPVSFRDLFTIPGTTGSTTADAKGAFANFQPAFQALNNGTYPRSISCAQLFYVSVQLMRWEAAHSYCQLIDAAPTLDAANPVNNEQSVLYSLFYGWPLKSGPAPTDPMIAASDLPEFTRNLHFVHVVRNSFQHFPDLIEQRFAPSERTESFTQTFMKTMGQKQKYAEVYSWALMVPYIQGVGLYFLAIAYPFCCVAMIMPGLHRMVISWMKYWMWLKIWDVGFALVMVLERSVWAMIGNGSVGVKLFPHIVKMKDLGAITADCIPAGTGTSAGYISEISDASTSGAPFTTDTDGISWYNAVRMFDRGLAIGSGIDLDLSNSYYIYLMAALYFAVPGVAGMLVGGASSIASGAVQGMTDGKGAPASAHTGETLQRQNAAGEQVRQQAALKSMRANDGLGIAAMTSGQDQFMNQLGQQAMGAQNGIIGGRQQQFGMGIQAKQQEMNANKGIVGEGARALGSAAGQGFGPMMAGTLNEAVRHTGALSGIMNALGQVSAPPQNGANAAPQPFNGGGAPPAGFEDGEGAGTPPQGVPDGNAANAKMAGGIGLQGGRQGPAGGPVRGGGNQPAHGGAGGPPPQGGGNPPRVAQNGGAGAFPTFRQALGQGWNAVGTEAGKAPAYVAALATTEAAGFNIEMTQAGYGAEMAGLKENQAAQAQMTANNASAAGFGMMGSVAQQRAQRQGAGAAFAAGDAKFGALNRLNQSRAGALAIQGANFIQSVQGQKGEQLEGAAYMGQLNQGNSESSADRGYQLGHFFDQGGAVSNGVNNYAAQLQQAGSSVGTAFHQAAGTSTAEYKQRGADALGQGSPGFNPVTNQPAFSLKGAEPRLPVDANPGQQAPVVPPKAPTAEQKNSDLPAMKF